MNLWNLPYGSNNKDQYDQKSEWRTKRWYTIIQIAVRYDEQQKTPNEGREYTDFAELELIAPDFNQSQGFQTRCEIRDTLLNKKQI